MARALAGGSPAEGRPPWGAGLGEAQHMGAPLCPGPAHVMGGGNQ